MATAIGLASQDIKLGGAGGEGAGGGGAAAAAVAITTSDPPPAPVESAKLNHGVPVIPLDLERRKISPRTKKLVLAKLGAATTVEDGQVVASVASDPAAPLSPPAAAQADKPALPAVDPSEQQDSRTSPSAHSPPSDLEKKQRRAERFGLDLQISESEKRTIRAARFGATSGATDHGTKAATTPSSEAESDKRKARAARFGSKDSKDIKEPPVSADVGKKKARAARLSVGPSTDAAEQEKRKARAARFGSSPHGDADSSKKSRMADAASVVTS